VTVLRALPQEVFNDLWLPPSILTAYDTFDGSSSVIDPTLVSTAFWSTLTTKVTSLILGQIVATLVLTIAVSIASTQLSGVVDRLSQGFLKNMPGRTSSTPPLRIPKDVGTTDVSPTSRPMDLSKLAICIAIDILGTSSELIPIVGEFTDLVYAPIAATLLRSLFYGSNVAFVIEFGEEILPFTDILPFATICWCVDSLAPRSGLAKFLQLGDYRLEDNTTPPTNGI
jgi:hypothetical protein